MPALQQLNGCSGDGHWAGGSAATRGEAPRVSWGAAGRGACAEPGGTATRSPGPTPQLRSPQLHSSSTTKLQRLRQWEARTGLSASPVSAQLQGLFNTAQHRGMGQWEARTGFSASRSCTTSRRSSPPDTTQRPSNVKRAARQDCPCLCACTAACAQRACVRACVCLYVAVCVCVQLPGHARTPCLGSRSGQTPHPTTPNPSRHAPPCSA